MKRQRISQGYFATTQWHVVRQSTEGPDWKRIEALNQICSRYGPALVEFVRRQFEASELDAEELVQQFVTDRVLAKNLLTKAEPSKGKFRTFLMTSIKRFVLDQFRRQRTDKRRPPNGFVSMDSVQSDAMLDLDTDEQRTFDQSFVRQIIAEAIHRTHEYCIRKNQTEIWEILYERVLIPHIEERAPVDYDTLVEELGLRSRAEAQNKLATGKRTFQRCFQEVIMEFTASAEEFEEEWAYLSRFFSENRQDLKD
jgi:RNA polymerase sigma-70 factor (ECF subfamily)